MRLGGDGRECALSKVHVAVSRGEGETSESRKAWEIVEHRARIQWSVALNRTLFSQRRNPWPLLCLAMPLDERRPLSDVLDCETGPVRSNKHKQPASADIHGRGLDSFYTLHAAC